MPPSQLKRLKTSLREQGVTGPQKSKKQKKAAANKSHGNNASDRAHRETTLQQLREAFNPFEFQAPARPAKFEHAGQNAAGGRYARALHRPGVSKSAGEELRRKTLLPEMKGRGKVGGVVDRRFGEGDEKLTAEERAARRFARVREGGRGVFDLEGSDGEEGMGFGGLTHGGRRIDELEADDFGEMSGEEEGSDDEDFLKRKRAGKEGADEENDQNVDDGEMEGEPQRKKSKHEVMQEVIAKSKLHKYERQKVKEDDEDLREELDGKMDDLLSFLRGQKPRPAPPKPAPLETTNGKGAPSMNPDRQRLLDGMDRAKVDKEYDARLKLLAQDSRAQPSERTKTEEEKALVEAARLKRLEERRVKRMQGEVVSDQEDAEDKTEAQEDEVADEAAEFGFTNTNAFPEDAGEAKQVVLDGEDEFALDEDLIASGSDVDISEGSASDEDSDAEQETPQGADEEDEFVAEVLGTGANGVELKTKDDYEMDSSTIAYTYPCPRSHAELLEVTKETPVEHLHTIIQRIRALYHPSLNAANKDSMADFSSALVEHLVYMGDQRQPLAVAEQVIRHLHSLSRTYAETIAKAYRRQLQLAHERKDFVAGDLLILTAIGSTYPTSDHFHQVVTPAITLMARWLGLTAPDSPRNHSRGAFLVALCLKYQILSKRYIPEAVRFTYRALADRSTATSDRRKAHLDNLLTMIDLWSTKTAFPQIFHPFLPFLKSHASDPASTRAHRQLTIALRSAHLTTRPLILHHHRPLAIRTSIPKFEENFDPNKHYDPDKDRADAKKLQKEYKRERKGALRELRKDANFVAREQLREKRIRDEEYERKYRRLVAEIQGEEGREANEYGREKERRKRQKK